MNRLHTKKTYAGLLGLAAAPALAQGQPVPDQRPNILCIVCEDSSPHLGCYGDTNARTPNIDRLAAGAVRYTNMYTTVGVSAPSRFALITGMYPSAMGANYMRTTSGMPEGVQPYEVVTPPGVKCYTEYLRREGYYCINNKKTDYQFRPPLTAWDENGGQAHWKNRPEGMPFLAVFNLEVTHESRIWERTSLPLAVDPGTLRIPPYMPDTETVRHDLAVMYSNLYEMDRQAQALIDELHEAGLERNTIIIFYADNGGPLQRGKREIYQTGANVPFMIRYPDARGAGTTDEELHMFVDIPATILSLCGVRPPRNMHGRAFGGKYRSAPRDYVYGARDRMDAAVDKQGGVSDGVYRYVRNYMPERPGYMNNAYQNQIASLREMIRLFEAGELNPDQARWFEAPRRVEEFYDLRTDPYELNNLIDDPEYAGHVSRLRKAYEKWIRRYNKTWLAPEKESYERFCPGGEQQSTAEVRIQIRNGKAKLSCPTEGSSIAYRISTNAEPGRWMLYTGPVALARGEQIEAAGVRIGFKPGRRVTRKFE